MLKHAPTYGSSPLRAAGRRVDLAADFVRSSLGRAPESDVRSTMEHHFSLSFAHVRIHNGPDAAKIARALGASAFTYGGDIVLGGDVVPKSVRGQLTLAHEFAHVAQQQRGPANGAEERRASTLSEEGEARAAVAHFVAGRPSAPMVAHTGAVLACAEPDAFASLEGFFKEEEPWPENVPPPREIAADPMRMLQWEEEQMKKRAEYKKKLELLERWKKEAPGAQGAGGAYSHATAEKEPTMDPFPNAVVFDGSHLLLRRGGKVRVSTDAGSGHTNVSDERAVGEGPLPDGIYTLNPQKRARAIDKWQAGGIHGAAGIDAGYQVILDPSVQSTWGAQRIRIEGEKLGRVGFFIHGGGAGYTTSGCIKHQSTAFWAELLKFGASIPLVVQKINRRVATK